MPDNECEYGCVMPFWIDTDAYSDRDRLMFVCGVEFQQTYAMLSAGAVAEGHPIHRENESRIRMMAAKLGAKVEIKRVEGYGDTWSELTVIEPAATEFSEGLEL